MLKDPRNNCWLHIICAIKDGIQIIKEAATRLDIQGLRVLRGQYYPLKVDGATRTAVLDEVGDILPEAAEEVGRDDNFSFAIIAWFSNKNDRKGYETMVLYST